jgi:hypothetical protein
LLTLRRWLWKVDQDRKDHTEIELGKERLTNDLHL